MEHFVALATAPMFIHEGVDSLYVTHVNKAVLERLLTATHRVEGPLRPLRGHMIVDRPSP